MMLDYRGTSSVRIQHSLPFISKCDTWTGVAIWYKYYYWRAKLFKSTVYIKVRHLNK
jgi:hypothetical protein